MNRLLILLLFFSIAPVFSQPAFVLTSAGFDPVEIARPNKTDEKLIEASKNWADYYIKQEHDVYNVTENSLSIDAMRDNAFFYRNLGELYTFRIKYTLQVSFGENTCRIKFIVKEIYAKKTLMKTTIADFFLSDGTLKEDFEEVKPSLEKTANKVLNSYIDFIQG